MDLKPLDPPEGFRGRHLPPSAGRKSVDNGLAEASQPRLKVAATSNPRAELEPIVEIPTSRRPGKRNLAVAGLVVVAAVSAGLLIVSFWDSDTVTPGADVASPAIPVTTAAEAAASAPVRTPAPTTTSTPTSAPTAAASAPVRTPAPTTTSTPTAVKPNRGVADLDPNPEMADVIVPSSIAAGETIRVAGTWSLKSGIGFISLSLWWETSPGNGLGIRCEAGSELVWETESPRASVTEVLTCKVPKGLGDGLYILETTAMNSRSGGESVSSRHVLSISGGTGVASGPIVDGLSLPSSVPSGGTVQVTGTWAHPGGVHNVQLGLSTLTGETINCDPGSQPMWLARSQPFTPPSVTTTLTCILPSNLTPGTYRLRIYSRENLIGYESWANYDLFVGD